MTNILHCLAVRQKIFIFSLFLVLPSVFLILPVSVSAQEYSLEELYRLALSRSERIKLSEENLLISKINRDKAFAALIPTLSAVGNYTQYQEDKKSSTGSIMQPDYNNSWGLKIEKSLSLSGREFTALQGATDNIEKNLYDLMSVQEEYLSSVSESFYSVLQARQAVQIANANLERLKKYQDAAQKRLRIGEVTKTALLRANGEVSGALSDQIKAKNRLSMAKVLLARIVGIDNDFDLIDKEFNTNASDAEVITPQLGMVGKDGQDTSSSIDSETASLPILQEMAEKNRYELKSLKAQREMAEKQIKYTKGALWPTATVSGVYNRLNQEPKSVSGYNDEAISASLSLNFPFYDGGLRRLDIKEAEAQKRQIDLMYRDQEKIIKVEVENAWLDVSAQKSVIKYLEDQVVFATNNYYAISKQFEFGLSDSMDIIDANNLLLTSQLKLSDAKYNYQLSVLKLKRAAGSLLEEVEKQS
ncbi:MAG: TolC family protein [Desulfamplus sp.]|nr:TolC family protein [Desulfamplus sp.]